MNGDERSLFRAVRGPITLITIGGLFALNNFTRYRFDQTWPVILIVFGLLSLFGRSAPQYRYPAPPVPPAPSWQQGPSYRQSSYTAPPQNPSPSKGGFGTTAPRPNDPSQTPGGNA